MRLLTQFVLLLSFGFCYSQNIILSRNLQQQRLFHEHKNYVRFGTTDGRPFELQVENGSLFKDTVSSDFDTTVRTYIWTNGSDVRVIMLDPVTKSPFDTLVFETSSMPAPIIFWGATPDGAKASRAETRLIARFGDDILLQQKFTIVGWEMQVAGNLMTVSGSGDRINEKATSILNRCPSGSEIIFRCLVTVNGIVFRRNAVFYI